MVYQLPLTSIIHQLTTTGGKALVSIHGWPLTIERPISGELFISTAVYKGDRYIPPSVRNALSGDPFEGVSHLPTHVSLDEPTYVVTLHYDGYPEDLREETLTPLLDEFSWNAEQWWRYLDDHDRRDLVYLYIK